VGGKTDVGTQLQDLSANLDRLDGEGLLPRITRSINKDYTNSRAIFKQFGPLTGRASILK
jgi:hypothetical protein